MKTIKTILSFAIIVFFTTSCGNNDESISEKASEKLSEKIIENATGNKVDIDVDKDGDKGSLTIKGDNGEEITISSEGKDIPDNFPSDIYLIDGEIVSVGTVNSTDGDIITVVKSTDASLEDTGSKITKEMKAEGWKSEMNMTTADGGMQMYSKDDNSVTVTLGKEDGKTQVNYMVTVSKK